MSELTIQLDDDLLARSEARARDMGIDVSEYIARTLAADVGARVIGPGVDTATALAQLDAMFARADARNIGSNGEGWSRADIYGDRY